MTYTSCNLPVIYHVEKTSLYQRITRGQNIIYKTPQPNQSILPSDRFPKSYKR